MALSIYVSPKLQNVKRKYSWFEQVLEKIKVAKKYLGNITCTSVKELFQSIALIFEARNGLLQLLGFIVLGVNFCTNHKLKRRKFMYNSILFIILNNKFSLCCILLKLIKSIENITSKTSN